MDFSLNKLPSSSIAVKSYWDAHINENLQFSKITIGKKIFNFKKPKDCFRLKTSTADKISSIGEKYNFLSMPVSLKEFEFEIFDDLNSNSHIGTFLNSITTHSSKSIPYAIYGAFIYHEKSAYCAFTVCIADDDTGVEMDTAVIAISQDESDYIQPIFINVEALDYLNYDDIAKIAYWLGNLWVGVQFEIINCPEEIHIIEKRNAKSAEASHSSKQERQVTIKTIISIDKDGNAINYSDSNSTRKYTLPSWGVRGHIRTLANGKETHVRPYRKGKQRNNPNFFQSKEYKFDDNKIDEDLEK